MKKDSYRCIREYVKKDGSITYHAEVRRHPAKPIRQKFRTLTAAKNWVRETETAILNGQQIPDNKARKLTLNDLIDQYLRLHLNKHPRRLKDQTPHLNWWRERYGTRVLMNITSGLLAEAREELLAGITSRNLPRTNSTVNRYFSSLSKAFTLAYQEWQWITDNPFKRITKLKENKGRSRFLNRDELNRFLDCCKQSRNPHLFGMVLIAFSMGMRFGEIANIRWKTS
jgi:integrase